MRLLFTYLLLFILIHGSCRSIAQQQMDSVFQNLEKDSENFLEYYQESAQAYQYLGDYEREQKNNYPKALEHYFKSVKINEKLADSSNEKIARAGQQGLISNYNSIGHIHYYLNNYYKAHDFYFISLNIAEELGGKEELGVTNRSMGNIHFALKNYQQALTYYGRGLRINEGLNDERGMAISLNNIARVYDYQGNYVQAQNYYTRSLKLHTALGDKPGVTLSLNNMGELFFRKGNYKKAIEYSNKSLATAKEIGAKNEIKNALYNLTVTHAKLREYKKAYEYRILFANVKDSIYNEVSSMQIAELQEKYEAGKKEEKIELLSKEKEIRDLELKRNIFIKYALGSGLILVLIIALIALYIYRLKYKAAKQLEVKQVELTRVNSELKKLSWVPRKTNDFVIITDKFDKIEWVNRAFTKITGYNLREAIGMRPEKMLRGELTDPETEERIKEKVEKNFQFEEEIVNYHKNGRKLWLSFQVIPILNEKGKLTNYITIGDDITAKKELEERFEQLNKHVEQRVEKQINKLSEANEKLQKEITELRRIEEKRNKIVKGKD